MFLFYNSLSPKPQKSEENKKLCQPSARAALQITPEQCSAHKKKEVWDFVSQGFGHIGVGFGGLRFSGYQTDVNKTSIVLSAGIDAELLI